jgi:phosphatidylglycerophosphate synthase
VGTVVVRPRVLGKIATVLQMAVVIWVLLKLDSGSWGRWTGGLMLGAAVCTGISGLLYVWDGVRQLSAHPISSSVKK